MVGPHYCMQHQSACAQKHGLLQQWDVHNSASLEIHVVQHGTMNRQLVPYNIQERFLRPPIMQP